LDGSGCAVSQQGGGSIFWNCSRGNVAVVTALLLPVLLMVSGVTLDYASLSTQRAKLQAIVDGAAVAAGRELTLAGTDKARVLAVARAFIDSRRDANYTLKAKIDTEALRVELDVSVPSETAFGKAFGLETVVPEISAMAISEIVGTQRICVLGLNKNDGGTIGLDKSAKITANGCAVFSNSRHGDSIKAKERSELRADLICSAGGIEGPKDNFIPAAIQDCPRFEDPLSGRGTVASGNCTFTEKIEAFKATTLDPGTYCEGLVIGGNATVNLNPGTYIFEKNGLEVKDTARVLGSDVTLVFSGAGSKLLFDRDTSIRLTGQETGPFAGMLIVKDRATSYETFKILSNDARELVGTIYLPNGELYVETEQPVADSSAYTAVVVDRLTLIDKAHLVLNTNYHLTDVPVPNGIKGVGEPVVLRQ